MGWDWVFDVVEDIQNGIISIKMCIGLFVETFILVYITITAINEEEF